MYKIFIKTDKDDNIIFVTSSFYTEQHDMIVLDEGEGSNFAFPINYFENPIQEKDGNYNYKYKNGKLYKNEIFTEKEPINIKTQSQFNIEMLSELTKLKIKLGVE